MCGIAGFVGLGSVDDLKKMIDAQIHRGPDDEGVWVEKNTKVYLGHRRLSILDLRYGHQPMLTADGSIVIVFNGEIYNFIELREELERNGHIFITDHSDTEVLLHGYREWGIDLTQKLNGMWAFAIYDRQKNIIFCSRDRFGEKPFYYTSQNGIFAFASELSALIKHSKVKDTISREALKKYFAYNYIPAPHSFYKDIYKLPAGHSLIFDILANNVKVIKYWDFILESFDLRPRNIEKKWEEELLNLLHKSVRQRLVSDVPLGVFLSGGVDSSAVAALAARDIPRGKLSTFSIGFTEATFNEADYAKKTAEYIGVDHHQEMLSMNNAADLIPDIIKKLDEPLGDSSLLPTYLLCRYARQHVTVALGGDGADELFAGYDTFKALKLADFYQKIVPKPLHRAVRLLFSFLPVSHKYMSFDFRVKRMLLGLDHSSRLWNPVWLSSLNEKEFEEFFKEPINIEDIYSEAIDLWDKTKQKNLVDKTLQFFTNLYFQNDILAKVDRASMMNSLEVRSPFLDFELVDFVRKIPSEYKFRNGETKYIFKKSLEPILPKDIIYRTKQGFAAPVGKWFREGSFNFQSFADSSILNSAFTIQKLYEHRQNKFDHRFFLWNQWVLSSMLDMKKNTADSKAFVLA